jgi:antitoxin (DNA-binding transcriptional repressor) of toxin-antitoxin stability system
MRLPFLIHLLDAVLALARSRRPIVLGSSWLLPQHPELGGPCSVPLSSYANYLDARTCTRYPASMTVTTSQLRQNIYRLLDRVIKTGQPLEVERKGQKLKIIPAERLSRLGQLPKRSCIEGDANDLVSLDWSDEWRP